MGGRGEGAGWVGGGGERAKGTGRVRALLVWLSPCGHRAGGAAVGTGCRRRLHSPTDILPRVRSSTPPRPLHQRPYPLFFSFFLPHPCSGVPNFLFPLPFLSHRVLVEGGTAYIQSDAPLRIAARLSPAARLAATAALAAPRLLRDGAYDTVAANRYDWFGTAPAEGVAGGLTSEQRARFYLD